MMGEAELQEAVLELKSRIREQLTKDIPRIRNEIIMARYHLVYMRNAEVIIKSKLEGISCN